MEQTTPDARVVTAALIEACREDLVARYRFRLRQIGSALAADERYLDQAAAQASLVITDVAVSLAAGEVRLHDATTDLSREIGTTRASTHVHPSESLQAASELFDLVVGVLADAAPATEVMTIGVQAVHRSVMTRIRAASGTYVSQLLDRVRDALLVERRRIGRELHDRVGGRASVVLRKVELADVYLTRDPARAKVQLDLAHDGVVATIEAIRHVATELRLEAEVDQLEKALRTFLEAMADAGTNVQLTVSGDEGWVPPATLDEVFQVVREALRNALCHAGPATVRTAIDIAPHEIRIVVSDDGSGFDADPARPGTGIQSMRDRVDGLGGRLTLVSAAGQGTRVDVMIPLPADEPS